ncbi:MAG: HPF/RaiA family ribosome-associated protein, partial [Terracidiphilus sp.]
MDVALTARNVKVSKALRAYAEEGMERIGRVLGRTARASITFSSQRHVHVVELTVQARTQKIAATGKASTPDAALREAIEHAEHQAHRYRDRRLVSKRLPRGEKIMTALPVARPKARIEPDADAEEAKSARLATRARASMA